AVITRPPSTNRSVPSTTARFVFAAADATRDQACSRNPGSGGRHYSSHAPIPGNEAFRKTDEVRALSGRLRDRPFGQHDRFLGSRREFNVRECDPKYAHVAFDYIRRGP